MQMFIFTPAEDLSLSFLTKTLCNRLSFLSSLISAFYEFLALSSTSERLSQHTLICSFWTVCNLWAIYTHFILMFPTPSLPRSREDRQHLSKCCQMHNFLQLQLHTELASCGHDTIGRNWQKGFQSCEIPSC